MGQQCRHPVLRVGGKHALACLDAGREPVLRIHAPGEFLTDLVAQRVRDDHHQLAPVLGARHDHVLVEIGLLRVETGKYLPGICIAGTQFRPQKLGIFR